MAENKTVSAKIKVLSCLLGALLGGFMWRCRGESGFGSSWGLYSVGLMVMMLIFAFYGKKRNMHFEYIPVGALLMGLGVTGYATVIAQMAGVVESDLPYLSDDMLYGAVQATVQREGDSVYAPINPFSGMVIILIMGFTLVPLFSFFIGTVFTDKKKYELKDYVIAVAVFFLVQTVAKASIAHPIVKLINPDQVAYAAKGLAYSGFDYKSPAAAYLSHFLDRRWAQEIPFFENYYMSVEHVSDLIATLTLMLYPLIKYKDRITFSAQLFINIFVTVQTTAFSLLHCLPFNTGFMAKVNAPAALVNESWGLWEFITGMGVGFATMLFIAVLPEKYTCQTEENTSRFIQSKGFEKIFNIIICIFIFGVTPARVLGIRFAKALNYGGIIENSNPLGDILTVVLSVVFAVFILRAILSKSFRLGDGRLCSSGTRFSAKAFPAYLSLCFFAYFFLNHAPIFHLPYSEFTSVKAFIGKMVFSENFLFTLMFVTFILIFVLYGISKSKIKKSKI